MPSPRCGHVGRGTDASVSLPCRASFDLCTSMDLFYEYINIYLYIYFSSTPGGPCWMERAVAHVPLENERWWMGTGVAGCSATDEGKKKAAHKHARPRMGMRGAASVSGPASARMVQGRTPIAWAGAAFISIRRGRRAPWWWKTYVLMRPCLPLRQHGRDGPLLSWHPIVL
jgi:hypothetical protein